VAEAVAGLEDVVDGQLGSRRPVGHVYPLSEAAAAVRYLADGHALGKVVIGVCR
jgi:NADPH:quinone reductase-like Zn-dependent oxidoreductase